MKLVKKGECIVELRDVAIKKVSEMSVEQIEKVLCFIESMNVEDTIVRDTIVTETTINK